MAKEAPFMPAPGSNWNLIGCLIPVVAGGLLLYNCSGGVGTKEASVGIEAIGAVNARLRDPENASFDQMYQKGTAYCGKVNAPNAFGGKSGWQRFVYADRVAMLEEDGPAFAQTWQRHCI